MKKIHILIPQSNSVSNINRQWEAKARFTMELKLIDDNKINYNKSPLKNIEYVIIGYNGWKNDLTIIETIKWLNKYSFNFKVLNPKTWSEFKTSDLIIKKISNKVAIAS